MIDLGEVSKENVLDVIGTNLFSELTETFTSMYEQGHTYAQVRDRLERDWGLSPKSLRSKKSDVGQTVAVQVGVELYGLMLFQPGREYKNNADSISWKVMVTNVFSLPIITLPPEGKGSGYMHGQADISRHVSYYGIEYDEKLDELMAIYNEWFNMQNLLAEYQAIPGVSDKSMESEVTKKLDALTKKGESLASEIWDDFYRKAGVRKQNLAEKLLAGAHG